ncbi:MAG: hypothetical protein NC124_08345 [Clostridium sp.]|nr:hypothetical protein [Clostridium sp.]
MGNRVLVTGATKNQIDAIATMILNLKEKSPNLVDEMIVFHDGVSNEIQEKIREIMPVTFIRYQCPISLWRRLQNKTLRYFSSMIFCKLECLRLLDEYQTVIWIDYDIVIKDDISEILGREEAFSFLFCEKDKMQLKDMFYPKIKKANMEGYDLSVPGICASLFVFKRQGQPYREYYRWCYEMTRRYMKYLWLPEQCIFCMMIQRFGIKCGQLDERKYNTHPKDDGDDVKIIHAMGQPKFWNGLENAEWNRYHQEWERIKGTKR